MKTSVTKIMMSFALMGCLIFSASDAMAQGRGRSVGGSTSSRSQSAAVSRSNSSTAPSVSRNSSTSMSRSSSATPQVNRSSSSTSRSSSATPQVNRSSSSTSRSSSATPQVNRSNSSTSRSSSATPQVNRGSSSRSDNKGTRVGGATTRSSGNSINETPRRNENINDRSTTGGNKDLTRGTGKTRPSNGGKPDGNGKPDGKPNGKPDGNGKPNGNNGNVSGDHNGKHGGDHNGNSGSIHNDRSGKGNKGNRPGSHNGNDRPGGKHGNNRGYNPDHRFDYSNHHYRDEFSRNYSSHNWSRPLPPPARAHRPAPLLWYRPVIPVGWHAYAGAPVIDRILGIMFGTLYESSLDYLYYNGYYIDGYADNIIYLRDVPMLNLYWPDVILNYEYGKLANAQFIYHSSYYDRSRFNRAYNSLCRIYGSPVFDDGMTASWYGGNTTGWVTLTLSDSYGDYYTTMSIGY